MGAGCSLHCKKQTNQVYHVYLGYRSVICLLVYMSVMLHIHYGLAQEQAVIVI